MTTAPQELAARIAGAFRRLAQAFADHTLPAAEHFAAREWQTAQRVARARLALYTDAVDAVLAECGEPDSRDATDRARWRQAKGDYCELTRQEVNRELARTFFNSVTRRRFDTVGVDTELEFTADEAVVEPRASADTYARLPGAPTADLLEQILDQHPLGAPFADRERDVTAAAARIDRHLRFLGVMRIDYVETVRSVFYRNKAAYIVGRMYTSGLVVPLVLALAHPPGGVEIDAVLTRENDVSILFSFTRSYFSVNAPCPREIIAFLRTILPNKPANELYTSLGLHKHGKTVLYHNLMEHLGRSSELFVEAEGDAGMVMLVFTLPGLDIVFKLIRDRFDYPKTNSRTDVLDRYRLVFRHDRVGRLVDAQAFTGLSFPADRFEPDLLDQLLAGASHEVRREGDRVDIDHLYTERQVTPLNLYLRRATEAQSEAAVLDYGRAIRELAAANIFPGDFLLKNFGVTRHGRVVFYDYDELCLLTDCNFRRFPPPRTPEEELASEPWFTVGERDIFPEEFRRFLGLRGRLEEIFVEHHSELFDADFWKSLQDRHNQGEILDFVPYGPDCRLR